VKVSTRDIGFVRVGDPAVIKVDAFSYVEHGTAAGKVQWISENAFWVNEQTNLAQDPYYKVGVSIDAMNFINVPENFRLVPGMTLTADIKVGRRSLGAYLLDGFVKGLNQSMREP
jgi:HlyD family secretion protein